MIRAIIFDCFGVLAKDGWTPFKQKYLAHDPELLKKVATLGRQSDLGNQDSDQTTITVARMAGVEPDELRKALKLRSPNDELIEYIRSNLKSKYKIGMMSNASYDVINELFKAHHIDILDAYVLSYESGLAKPDHEMFRLVARRLGEEIENCLFVDDQERYCLAAKEAGAQALWYRSFEQFKDDLARHLA
jgi:HAD superfamily hydrolase (TIGR01509 family)